MKKHRMGMGLMAAAVVVICAPAASLGKGNGGGSGTREPGARKIAPTVIHTLDCTNLVANGSFEIHDAFNMGTWGTFNRLLGVLPLLPNWIRGIRGPFIEVGTAETYGVTGHEGNDVCELDGNANTHMRQSVPTTPGKSYTLSFLTAKRDGTADSSNQISIIVDESYLDDTINPTSTVMAFNSYQLIANNTSMTLEFRGGGTSDSVGSILDDVRLTETYDVNVLHDQNKLHKKGSTVPLKIQVVSCEGTNISASDLGVHAVLVALIGSADEGIPEDAGNANPDSNFRYDATLGDSGGYIFNLKTTGMASGEWELRFSIGQEYMLRSVKFQIK